ncbi:MAG: hypothetical protein WAQ98_11300 [Blastocatellia bacterium]
MRGNRSPKPRKTTADEAMVRREYYVRKDQDEWLKNESKKLDKPAAEIIREALDQIMLQKVA